MSTREKVGTAPATPLRVGDLKQGGFAKAKAIFTNSREAIEIINFFDFLAQNNAVSADAIELPLEDKTQEWKLTRADATKLFFSHIETRAAEIAADIKLPDKAAQSAIQKAIDRRWDGVLDRAKSRLCERMNQAEEHLSQMNSYLAQATEIRVEIDRLKGLDSRQGRLSALMEALPRTNWNFQKIEEDILCFESRSEIYLRHVDKKAGLHYEFNCGRFILRISLRDMAPYLFPGPRAITRHVGRNIHPHVSNSGEVCFGNASDAAKDARLDGDIVKLIGIIDALLPNYGGNPFIGLEDFKKLIEKRDALEKADLERKAKGYVAEEEEVFEDEPDFEDEWEPVDDEDGEEEGRDDE